MIIAKRMLRIVGAEHDIEVPVIFHMPVEDDRAWRCDYEIGWPGAPWVFRALGYDGVQALQLAMFAVGTDLCASSYHQAGLLVFDENDPSYGFPAKLPPDVGREDH